MKPWYKLPPSRPPQREFIQFCKSLYSMFHGDPEENDLFQAIATVTSLVLQIGEASHHAPGSPSDVASQDGVKGACPSPAESDWTVSYAQILASLLTEQALVNFFEKPLDLSTKLEEAKEKQYHQRVGLLTLQQGTRWLKCEQWKELYQYHSTQEAWEPQSYLRHLVWLERVPPRPFFGP